MIDKELEEILSAEHERITSRQRGESGSDLAVIRGLAGSEAQAPNTAASPVMNSLPAKPITANEKTARGSTVGANIGSAARDFAGSRLNAMPLISTLVGLFSSGEDPEPPPPLIKYAMPRTIHVSAANSHDVDGYLESVDYGQDGIARAYSDSASARPKLLGGEAPASPSSNSTNLTAPQIVVNVQAMDSRSFLDHSGEIAQAVREAMLNMHALNDVVSEL